ncbi:hypothetical protein Psuf_056320 [Phytohabitans suffuscus]|uniref:Uncharacterized protein n=1 Tax=Phytohabitans suffuscus TaxID=624315 RepID=A0A6F8YQJ0_9ACTN|nr:hypothetical protein Psuf_056320 [Phytohabitans suffuscus]
MAPQQRRALALGGAACLPASLGQIAVVLAALRVDLAPPVAPPSEKPAMPSMETANSPPTTYISVPPARPVCIVEYMMAIAPPLAIIGSSISMCPNPRDTGSASSGGGSRTSSPRGSCGAGWRGGRRNSTVLTTPP